MSTVIATDTGDRWRDIGVAFTSDKGSTITVLLEQLQRSVECETLKR